MEEKTIVVYVKCPNEGCKRDIRWDAGFAGKRAKCPYCQSRVVFPVSPDLPAELYVKPESPGPDGNDRQPPAQARFADRDTPTAPSGDGTVKVVMNDEDGNEEDYYHLLGIAPTAGEDEIKKAILDKTKQYRNRINHPDLKKRQSAERILAAIQKARGILLDPARRQEYDRAAAARPAAGPGTRAAHAGDRVETLDRINEMLERGRGFEAIPLAQEAVEKWPQESDAWAALGYAHASWGEMDKAVYELRRAVEIDPSKAPVHYDLGTILADNNRFDDAMSCFKRAAQINPAEAAYKAGQARVYYSCQHYKEAIDLLEPLYAAATEPAQRINYAYLLALTHNDWGASLQNEKNDLTGAFDHYQRASQIDFHDADLRQIIRGNLAQLRADPQSRLKAFIADFVACAVVSALLQSVLGGFGAFLAYLVVPGYFIFLTHTSGKTLGKAIFSLRVVDEDGNLPSLKTSAIRFGGFLGTLLLCGFIIGFFMFAPMLGEMKQTFYDKLAKTQVVFG